MRKERKTVALICSTCGQKVDRCEAGVSEFSPGDRVVCYLDPDGVPHHFASDGCLWTWLRNNDARFAKAWGFSLAKAISRAKGASR